MTLDTADVKRRLYQAAHSPGQQAELQIALRAWAQEDSAYEDWAEFLDFFALEWVDAEGLTLLDRVFAPERELQLLRWSLDLKNGLFLVDDWDNGIASLRDLISDEPLRARVADALPRRSVLRSRLLPMEDGLWAPTGEPDLYDPMSAMARIDLAETWAQSPRKALSERLASLRRAFIIQREQHAAFLELFGAEELIFDEDEPLRVALDRFLQHLFYRARPASQGGLTLAEAFRLRTGEEAPGPRAELGQNLQGQGRVGLLYDRAQGLHLLPWYGEFIAHMRGEASHPKVVAFYLQDPGIGPLPFQRHADAGRLAAALGCPPADLKTLLPRAKPRGRQAPSILPVHEP